MAQRGICPDDVRSVLENGTPVNDNAILMCRKDAAADPELRRVIGIVVVFKDGFVITVYRASPARIKTFLRNLRR